MPSTWGNTTPRLDGRRLDRDRNSALAFIGAAPSMTGIERALPREVGVRTCLSRTRVSESAKGC
jgi:hypothetical protein